MRLLGLAAVPETIQSLLVAFSLALAFRGFVVEGFVIPTGSMAPTLLGQHYRLRTPDTGYEYALDPTPVVQKAKCLDKALRQPEFRLAVWGEGIEVDQIESPDSFGALDKRLPRTPVANELCIGSPIHLVALPFRMGVNVFVPIHTGPSRQGHAFPFLGLQWVGLQRFIPELGSL